MKQKEYHDKSAKDLAPLMEGETVRVQTGGKWKPARVVEKLTEPCSYKIETEEGEYRRNRRHLLRTGETAIQIAPDTSLDLEPRPCHKTVPDSILLEPAVDVPQTLNVPSSGTSPPPSPCGTAPPRMTKSGQTIRTPAKYKDYEM